MELTFLNSFFYGTGAALTYLYLKHYENVKSFLRTPSRDIMAASYMIRVRKAGAKAVQSNLTVARAFDLVADKHPEKICFYFEDEKWTFKQFQEYANKIANYFSHQGFRKGDKVAFIMDNRPEYVATWLGLSKIGVIPSLINTNLRQESLRYVLEILPYKGVIYEEDTAGEALKEVNALGHQPVRLYCSKKSRRGISTTPPGNTENWVDLEFELDRISGEFRPSVHEIVNSEDPLFYSFTSGTTGFPKAAIIKNSRFLYAAASTIHIMRIKPSDVIYCALPLYHTTGGLLGLGPVLVNGSTMALRKKFSARQFWKDCIRYNVTVGMYIGETLRYLYSQPPSDLDRKHSVRKLFGLGLRKDLWEEFVKRFGISDIIEIYGSTEGNCFMINMFGKPGACGFIPRWATGFVPYKLVKVSENGQILRDDKTGRATLCQVNEPGEMIGKIDQGPRHSFEGYSDKAETEKKIIRGIFEEGDAYFRTGDILMMDELGYFYFKDRTGDTFRWKGENVSTQQVELVISKICNLSDVAVFGVAIPFTEGKAGMAAIADPENKLDLDYFATEIFKRLPNYSRPLFIRIKDKLNLTGTHKLQKADLQKEGFDIKVIADPIYFLNGSKYVPLTQEIFNGIMNGTARAKL